MLHADPWCGIYKVNYRWRRKSILSKPADSQRPMDTSAPTIKCTKCGYELTEQESGPPGRRKPCPKCSSKARLFQLTLASEVSFKSELRGKGKRPGRRKPFYELITGDSLFRLTGQWYRLQQIIDRTRDYYLKVVTDPKAGKLIRFCEEPLSQHQGRGSAKLKKPKSKKRK